MQTPNNPINLDTCPNAPVKLAEEIEFNLSLYEGRNLIGAFEQEIEQIIDFSLGG